MESFNFFKKKEVKPDLSSSTRKDVEDKLEKAELDEVRQRSKYLNIKKSGLSSGSVVYRKLRDAEEKVGRFSKELEHRDNMRELKELLEKEEKNELTADEKTKLEFLKPLDDQSSEARKIDKLMPNPERRNE